MFAKLRLPDICLTLLSVAFVAWAGLNGVCAFVYLIVVRGKVILQSQGKEFFTWHGKDFFT